MTSTHDEKKWNPYQMTRPCASCPFRSDRPGYLTQARVEEIRDSLVQGGFPCHKTTVPVDDDSDDCDCDMRETPDSQQCAGALILLEKENSPSQLMRIMERLRVYDRRKLDMTAPVHESWDDMIDAQPR